MRRIKDDCRFLTLKQCDDLLARDGLGDSCEYDVEALRARRFELLAKKADKIKMPWENVDNGGNKAPQMTKVERSGAGPSDDMAFIENALDVLQLEVKDFAMIIGVTVQAVSLWRNGHRAVPQPVINLVSLIIDTPELINKIVCFNKADTINNNVTKG